MLIIIYTYINIYFNNNVYNETLRDINIHFINITLIIIIYIYIYNIYI